MGEKGKRREGKEERRERGGKGWKREGYERERREKGKRREG